MRVSTVFSNESGRWIVERPESINDSTYLRIQQFVDQDGYVYLTLFHSDDEPEKERLSFKMYPSLIEELIGDLQDALEKIEG